MKNFLLLTNNSARHIFTFQLTSIQLKFINFFSKLKFSLWNCPCSHHLLIFSFYAKAKSREIISVIRIQLSATSVKHVIPIPSPTSFNEAGTWIAVGVADSKKTDFEKSYPGDTILRNHDSPYLGQTHGWRLRLIPLWETLLLQELGRNINRVLWGYLFTSFPCQCLL